MKPRHHIDVNGERLVLTLARVLEYFNGTTREALEDAVAGGWRICKLADPIEDAREGLTVDEALEVARADAGLLYLVRP